MWSVTAQLGDPRRIGFPDSGEMGVALDRRVGAAPLSSSALPFATSRSTCAQKQLSTMAARCAPAQAAALVIFNFELVCRTLLHWK